MSASIEKKLCSFIIAVIAIIFICSPGLASEKKHITGTAKSKRPVSRAISFPGDDAKHVIANSVSIETISSPDPDWNDIEATMYELSDQRADGGSHKGYIVFRHKNGDESYVKFEGTNKLVAGDGGKFEASFEGKVQSTGGTGKFKGIKGTGSYKGTANAAGSITSWEMDIEY